jgi:hypothetical protein
MSQEFFYTLLWARLSMGMEKYTPNRAHFFVRKKLTTFSTERIVALRSVKKIFPESYDFAAMLTVVLSLRNRDQVLTTY